MAEYIERDALIDDLDAAVKHGGMGAIIAQTLQRYVRRAPAADVAPVRHGWWLHSHYEDCSEHFEIVKCSNCGCEAYAMAFYVRGGNFCPNCGARMDGARNGEEKD